jgi:DNA-binding SARP family transcriptional activator
MTAARHTLLRLLALLGAVACPLVLLLLLEIRPPLPALPGSLSSPITLDLAQDTLALLAWGGSVALAVLLFVHSLRGLVAHRPEASPSPHRELAPSPRQRPVAHARLAAGAGQGAFPPPFPLIVRAPAAPRTEKSAPVRPPSRPRPELLPPSIAVLGPLRIVPSRPGRYGLRSQTQQLLAFLALHPDGAGTDELVAALCPDIPDEKARKRLWRSVSEARSQLGDVIVRAEERYRLDRDAVAVDVDRFQALLAHVDEAPEAEREQLLADAIALVRGQPLAGADYPWAVGEVRHLRATVVDRLEDLGYLRLDVGNPSDALAAAEQALELDPHNEGATRLAMRAESALGLRHAIADRYRQLCRGLDEGFGLGPERETRLLYRELLSQDASDSPTIHR